MSSRPINQNAQVILYTFLPLVFQTFVFGLSSFLTPLSLRLMSHKGLSNSFRKTTYYTTILTFSLTAIWWLFSVLNVVENVMVYGIGMWSESEKRGFGMGFSVLSQVVYVNFIVADLMIYWRAWVLCSDESRAIRKVLQGSFAFFVLTTLSLLSSITIRIILLFPTSPSGNKNLTLAINASQLSGLVFSLVFNLIVTGVVFWGRAVSASAKGAGGMKKKDSEKEFPIPIPISQPHPLKPTTTTTAKPSNSKPNKPSKIKIQTLPLPSQRKITSGSNVMGLIIESGVVYCMSGFIFLSTLFIRLPIGTLGDFWMPVCVQIAAIYPSLILLIIHLKSTSRRYSRRFSLSQRRTSRRFGKGGRGPSQITTGMFNINTNTGDPFLASPPNPNPSSSSSTEMEKPKTPNTGILRSARLGPYIPPPGILIIEALTPLPLPIPPKSSTRAGKGWESESSSDEEDEDDLEDDDDMEDMEDDIDDDRTDISTFGVPSGGIKSWMIPSPAPPPSAVTAAQTPTRLESTTSRLMI